MSKGKRNFLDFFRVNNPEEDDFEDENDDFLDDDDDDDFEDDFEEERKPVKPKKKEKKPSQTFSPSPSKTSAPEHTAPRSAFSAGDIDKFAAAQSARQTTNAYGSSQEGSASYKKKTTPSNVVPMDRRDVENAGDVYVIRPQEFDDAQVVADLLTKGRTIVINLEGVQLDPAQRIIDFIGGACYGLGGDLSAISNNIFIATPHNIEVSGDLRDEILNESSLVPNLGKY